MSNITCSNIGSDIETFYAGKSVFVTGGTGFLGKSLIEKLLYSCKNIDKIYVFVREKKGVKPYDRILDIINTPAFERLKTKRPKDLEKIVPVVGSIQEKNLGLSDTDLKCLEEKVSVVFHAAATVNFQEPLKNAIAINVDGTKELINICHRMKNIEAMVHVSTAYSNTDRNNIDEVIYPAPDSLSHIRFIADRYSDDEEIIKKIIGKRPNTYTYTKAFAEEIVLKEHGDIPTAIVRPSIVISALNDPSPGWVDNWNGPAGVIIAAINGILNIGIGKPSNVIDVVPVDFVNNLTIAAAAKSKRSKEVDVYNCCTGNSNPITLKQFTDLGIAASGKHAIGKTLFPFIVYFSSRFWFNLWTFLLQIIPSYFYDMWLSLNGKTPRFVKIQERIGKLFDALEFFVLNQWSFSDENVRKLWESLSKEDQKIFNFDVKSIDWRACLEIYVVGITKYLMKDENKKHK